MRLAAYLRLWALYSPGSHCSRIVELVKTIQSLVSKLDHMMLIRDRHGDSCGVVWGLNIRACSTTFMTCCPRAPVLQHCGGRRCCTGRTFPTAASPSNTSLTLLLGFGAAAPEAESAMTCAFKFPDLVGHHLPWVSRGSCGRK